MFKSTVEHEVRLFILTAFTDHDKRIHDTLFHAGLHYMNNSKIKKYYILSEFMNILIIQLKDKLETVVYTMV